MATQNPAATAIVDALKDPNLTPAARAALVAALKEVTATNGAQAPEHAAANPLHRAGAKATSQRAGIRITLTKKSVEALELPEQGEAPLVYDTVCPQLAVRRRPGEKTYVVSMWDRARRRAVRSTIGKCRDVTPEQARKAAQQLVARVVDGADVRRDRDEGATLKKLVDDWHAEKTAKKVRTADELRDKILDYAGKLAARPAREITREDIGKIHHIVATKARKRVFKRVGEQVQRVEVGDPGLPATADKWRAATHAVYAWAQAKGLVADNPCEGIQAAFDAKAAARTNYLRGEELRRFWMALEAETDAEARDAIHLLLFTGQRRGNVLGMRWADVDLGGGAWTVGADETKQKAAQTTPLAAQAVAILQRRFESAGKTYVFPAARGEGAMTETRVRDAWARICAAAKIEDIRVHDLRHTSGSWLARLGANEATRMKALGHKTSAMAQKYTHLETDIVADALQRVANAVEAEATKPKAPVRKFRDAV